MVALVQVVDRHGALNKIDRPAVLTGEGLGVELSGGGRAEEAGDAIGRGDDPGWEAYDLAEVFHQWKGETIVSPSPEDDKFCNTYGVFLDKPLAFFSLARKSSSASFGLIVSSERYLRVRMSEMYS